MAIEYRRLGRHGTLISNLALETVTREPEMEVIPACRHYGTLIGTYAEILGSKEFHCVWERHIERLRWA